MPIYLALKWMFNAALYVFLALFFVGLIGKAILILIIPVSLYFLSKWIKPKIKNEVRRDRVDPVLYGLYVLIGILLNFVFYDEIYPPRITEKQHARYLSLADKSFEDYLIFTNNDCDYLPFSSAKKKCLVSSSKKWIKHTKHKYDSLPSTGYTSGKDIAEEIISRYKK